MEIRYAFRMKVVEEFARFLKNAIWAFCICYLGYWFLQMLTDVSQSKEGSIGALARLVHECSIDRIVLTVTNAVTGIGWCQSRYRNKSLTKKLGDIRHRLESQDPVNGRSGLDEHGEIKGEQ